MHQYKIIAQTLLVLSILNLVLAAPVPRDTIPGGTTPSQDPSPSSDGSPPLNLEGSAPSRGSPSSSHLSATDGVPVYDSTTSARPLSAAAGPAPESYSITPASKSPYYSSATDRKPPAPESITPVTKTNKKFMGLSKPTGKQIMKYGTEAAYLAALTYAFVDFVKWTKENENKN